MNSTRFDGDFSVLPFRAQVDIGLVPAFPTSNEFQLAAIATTGVDPFSWGGVARIWYLEAVRERCNRPGAPLDQAALKVIAHRTAERLFVAQSDALDCAP